jgi:hypothetical protein
MINFVAQNEFVCDQLATNTAVIQEAVQLLTNRVNDKVPVRSKCAMLLCNLSLRQPSGICGADSADTNDVPQRFRRLVTLCAAMPELSDVEYVAPTLQNCARHVAVRRVLLSSGSSARAPIQAILDTLHSGSLIRRRGLAHLIRNMCLDEQLHRDILAQTSMPMTVTNRLFNGTKQTSKQTTKTKPNIASSSK